MNFAQLEFIVFLAIVVLVNARISYPTPRKIVLLVASYYFYAYWDYRFAGLLVFSTLLDYTIGNLLNRFDRPTVRRTLLLTSLIGNLGLLGFFKYYNFFIESAEAIFGQWGLSGTTLNIILPIGISFYTFQTLSYSIDVYRRTLRPCTSLLDFALYVAFFPQLVAGPIVRASEFLPQLSRMLHPQPVQIYSGLAQLLRGFVKKVLIADHLATFADPVFAAPDLYAWPTVVLAVLAYTGQIYGDFSGYSDIAIGSARLLGFELPDNFRHPYLSRSPGDFWRRWHITLSTWLRDYLYIPLGGNRVGPFFTYRNLIITMTLGGLWHGASWNFVIWGLWHGGMLCLTRAWTTDPLASLPRRIFETGITFSIVVIGWTLFRTSSIDQFFTLWSQLIAPYPGLLWLPPLPLIALALLMLEHAIWLTRYRSILDLPSDRWTTPWLVGFALAALAIYAPTSFRPFVYFQF
ncbi:MAG TPA: MBOAT family protein [Planctomycetaceae bacterium]|nr:MBOAT family protein [Planctomycetaceae bacterium]